MSKIRGFFIRLVGMKKKEKNIELKDIKRILIPGGRIGDMVCETPLIRELHELFPNAEIDVYLDKIVAPLFKNCPYLNVIETKRGSRFVHKVKILRIISSWYDALLKRKKYDLYFEFANGLRFYSIFALRIMKPRYSIGVLREEKHGIKKDELTIFDVYIKKSKSKHMRDISLAGIEVLGKNIKNRKYELFLGEAEERYKDYFYKENINIIFNYTGGNIKKNLSIEEVKESCKKLIEIDKRIVVYVMTLPDKYEELEEEIKKWEEKRIKICDKTQDIAEAAGMIKYIDILVSVDTGVVHIASAYNKPVISIFPDNENSIEYFSPKSELSYVIKCEDKSWIRDFDKEKMKKYMEEIIDKLK